LRRGGAFAGAGQLQITGRFAPPGPATAVVRLRQIVLQKSKVAGPRIFRENMNREEIADSYRLNRVAEAAGEFSGKR
jgi:hypothetical protein